MLSMRCHSISVMFTKVDEVLVQSMLIVELIELAWKDYFAVTLGSEFWML